MTCTLPTCRACADIRTQASRQVIRLRPWLVRAAGVMAFLMACGWAFAKFMEAR